MKKCYVLGMCSALALIFATHVCNGSNRQEGSAIQMTDPSGSRSGSPTKQEAVAPSPEAVSVAKEVKPQSSGYWGGWANPLNWFNDNSGQASLKQILEDALGSQDPQKLADALDHVSCATFKADQEGDATAQAAIAAVVEENAALIATCFTQQEANGNANQTEERDVAQLAAEVAALKLQLSTQAGVIQMLLEHGKNQTTQPESEPTTWADPVVPFEEPSTSKTRKRNARRTQRKALHSMPAVD